jgi:hypothetical protein
MKIDKQEFIASLGGPSAVDSMNPEAQADAIEDFMMKRLNEQKFGLALKGLNDPGAVPDASGKYPTVAEIEAQIETRDYRRGVGNLFLSHDGNVKRLAAMPAKPTLPDYFKHRFTFTFHRQSRTAKRASGQKEWIVRGDRPGLPAP